MLSKFLVLFKDFQGLGVTPRFNLRVTDLLYYAQGDGDAKKQEWINNEALHYEEPGKVFYRSDFTGTHRNFRLKIIDNDHSIANTQK